MIVKTLPFVIDLYDVISGMLAIFFIFTNRFSDVYTNSLMAIID